MSAPDLAAPRHRADVSAWAQAEAVASHLFWMLDQVHPVDAKAEPREALLRRWHTAQGAAAAARDRLGVGPVSEARLAQLRAEATIAGFDVNAVIAKGREIIAAREPEDDVIELDPGPEAT